LIQTVGRAARNSEGQVIMYADQVTGSMERAIMETNRRRAKQQEYNQRNGIVPRTIIKDVREVLEISSKKDVRNIRAKDVKSKERDKLIKELTKQMQQASAMLEFEYAAVLRDKIKELQEA